MTQAERGHIAYKKETTWGTVASPATKVWTMNSEAIIQNIEEILSKAHRRVLDEPASYQGLKTFGGPVDIEVHPDNFGDILRSVIWDPVTGWAARTVVVLEDCEDNWVSHVECISVLDNTDYKTGSGSVKIYVPEDVAAGVIIATETFAAVDMTDDDEIILWIKSSIDLAADQLKFVFASDGACATPDVSIAIDTALVAGVWKEVTITLPAMAGYTDVLSIGIEMDIDQIEFTLHLDDIRRVDTTGAAAAAAKDHVFTPSQDDFADGDAVKRCPLYSYTLELHRDQAGAEAFELIGAVVNTLNLKFGVDQKILTATAGILAKDANRITKTAVAFPTTSPFRWSQAVVKIATVQTNILESIEINIDNKLVGIPSLNNTDIIRKFYRSGPRTVDVNFVTDFADQVEYDLFVAGTEQALQIVFTGAAIIGDLTFYNTFTLDFPKFRYLTYPIANSGTGRLTVAVTGKAKYSVADAYSHVFTLRNVTADY